MCSMWLVGNGKVVIRPRDQTGLMRKMVIGFLVSSSQPSRACAMVQPCSSAWICGRVPPCPSCLPPMHLRALPQQAQLLLERVGVKLSQVRQLADGDALQIEGRVGERVVSCGKREAVGGAHGSTGSLQVHQASSPHGPASLSRNSTHAPRDASTTASPCRA